MNTIPQKLFLTLIAVVSVAAMTLPSLAQEKQTPKAKVAAVNGAVISQIDFNREMNIVQQRLTRMEKSFNDSQMKTLKNEVLERLINRELLYQESQKNGIKVEESAINEQIDALKKRFPNEDEFKKTLQNMDFSQNYLTTQITRDLAIKQFIDKQFSEKITVSDKEAKSYFDSHPDAFNSPEQVKASHILIKVDPKADESQKAAARKKIEEIQQRLKKGEDFATLAKEFSQCPSSAGGGDLGSFQRGQMVKPFEDAVFALAPGEVSGIVETEFGYHLIKSVDKKPKASFAYNDIKEKLKQHLKQNKVQEQVGEYVEELRKKAKVEIFMTENS
ncbi:MAG: peptidylprolyl isomerase [Deltaproteobacteria bacterium]|nr:peptidylprolyl isomerase [Deltaproteobacteria bacterium]